MPSTQREAQNSHPHPLTGDLAHTRAPRGASVLARCLQAGPQLLVPEKPRAWPAGIRGAWYSPWASCACVTHTSLPSLASGAPLNLSQAQPASDRAPRTVHRASWTAPSDLLPFAAQPPVLTADCKMAWCPFQGRPLLSGHGRVPDQQPLPHWDVLPTPHSSWQQTITCCANHRILGPSLTSCHVTDTASLMCLLLVLDTPGREGPLSPGPLASLWPPPVGWVRWRGACSTRCWMRAGSSRPPRGGRGVRDSHSHSGDQRCRHCGVDALVPCAQSRTQLPRAQLGGTQSHPGLS